MCRLAVSPPLLCTTRGYALNILSCKTRTGKNYYQPVCVRSIQEPSRRWRGPRPRCMAYIAPDARVGGLAQSRRRSRRHRLPPRTDDYVPGGTRTEGSQDPGTRRTPARWGNAKLGQSTALIAARGEHASAASSLGSERSPRTLPTKPTRLEAAPSAKQRLPKATPSPRRRDKDHDKRWSARRPHH